MQGKLTQLLIAFKNEKDEDRSSKFLAEITIMIVNFGIQEQIKELQELQIRLGSFHPEVKFSLENRVKQLQNNINNENNFNL